jgi:hypothetical protein
MKRLAKSLGLRAMSNKSKDRRYSGVETQRRIDQAAKDVAKATQKIKPTKVPKKR